MDEHVSAVLVHLEQKRDQIGDPSLSELKATAARASLLSSATHNLICLYEDAGAGEAASDLAAQHLELL